MPAERILVFNSVDAFSENANRAGNGIMRYARSRGWEVLSVQPSAPWRESVRSALARLRPVGCIVFDNLGGSTLPPHLFGSIPTVYLDTLENGRSGRKVSVYCDNAAVARAAFRELSASLPPCYAVVPSVSLRPWNASRIRVFRSLCAESGVQCRVFHGRRGEARASRLARLAPFVASLPQHSAIFAANDNTACDVAGVASAVGRAIPRELTLIGVDGGDTASDGGDISRISSVKLDIEQAGFMAAKALASFGCGSPSSASFGPLLVLRRESTRGFGRREPFVLAAVEIIRREACNGLTARELAARFPVSRNLFERRFREAMGHSVLDEILHVRLEQVQALLARRDMAIGAIAGLCGFNCEYALRKLFQARFGMSMQEWRRIRAF
ncbi:MAG: helix-turn-helix domain-containing protein [Kiritimatiellae bacterium]|nr:helix-turn-helix domain-containing protein [Kiritimatiellia bacterium]